MLLIHGEHMYFLLLVRGGACSVFACLWNKSHSPDEKVEFFDRNSQYAHVGINYEFPISAYSVSLNCFYD